MCVRGIPPTSDYHEFYRVEIVCADDRECLKIFTYLFFFPFVDEKSLRKHTSSVRACISFETKKKKVNGVSRAVAQRNFIIYYYFTVHRKNDDISVLYTADKNELRNTIHYSVIESRLLLVAVVVVKLNNIFIT